MTRIVIHSTLALSLIFMGGCKSFFTSLAANQTVNVMELGAASFDEESDPWLAREAATSNLKFFEGVLKAAPDNETLIVMIAKNYGLYAFAFLQEDLDKLQWDTPEYNEMNARMIDFYSRSRGYAIRRMAMDYEDFAEALAMNEDARLEQILEDADEEDHLPAIYWLAYSWGNLINLQTDDPSVVADLPRVKRLMAWVLERNPSFQNGGPHLFFGAIHLALPPALGGKPEESRKSFEAGIAVSDGRFLMGKALYAHYYMRATDNRAGYQRLLREVIDAPIDIMPDQKLANQLAKIRARRWLAETDEYFDVPEEEGRSGSGEEAPAPDGGGGDLTPAPETTAPGTDSD